jgi:hypothetical protein
MAAQDTIEYPPLITLSHDDITALADKLYGRAVSSISPLGRSERQDLIVASRCLRRLLAAFERNSGRQLSCIILEGC